MFAGHVGAALALGRAERRVSVGAFVMAALFLDAVLWVLILAGREAVAIPADFAATHQPEFVFPWSHGLAASLAWSVLAGAVAWALCARLGAGRLRAAALIAAAVLSHWVLDALVHRPELPLAGPASPRVGLGLWSRMPAALALEAAIALAGLWLFLPGARLARGRSAGLAVTGLVVLAFTVAGMTIAPAPPSAAAMAASSLATILVLVAIVTWLGREERQAVALPPRDATSSPQRVNGR